MMLEKMFIAGCIQDSKIVDRARMAKIRPHHLEGGIYRRIYESILKVSRSEPLTVPALKQALVLDLSGDDAQAACNKVDELLAKNLGGAELSLEELEKYRTKRDFVHVLNQASTDLLNNPDKDPKEILKQHEDLIGEISSSTSTIEIHNYYEDWETRRQERLDLSKDAGDTLKFIGGMSPFAKYLPRGQQRQEMTAIAGPTYSGKSVLLTNLIHMAASPENGFNCLYVFSENRKIQAASRLDAVFLDREYDKLYSGNSEDVVGDSFFRLAPKEGWGQIYMSRVVPGGFNSRTMADMIDFIRVEYDIIIDALFVDSPEHQRPIRSTQTWHLDKGEVWMDNKKLAEDMDLFFIGTTQMKASSAKGEFVSNEDLAGSYDISRHVDNIFAYNVNPDDRMLNRANIQVTKARDGRIDNKMNYFYFEKSHRMRPWEEIFGPDLSPSIENKDAIEYAIKNYEDSKAGEASAFVKVGNDIKSFNVRTLHG